EGFVGAGRRLLDEAERMDQRTRHSLGADSEILDGSLGLRSPQPIGRNGDRAEAVRLLASLHEASSLLLSQLGDRKGPARRTGGSSDFGLFSAVISPYIREVGSRR